MEKQGGVLRKVGVYQRSEVEGPLEASVSPGGSGIPQGSRGSLGRQVIPEVGGCPKRSKVLQKSGRSIRERVSPQKKWESAREAGPHRKVGSLTDVGSLS